VGEPVIFIGYSGTGKPHFLSDWQWWLPAEMWSALRHGRRTDRSQHQLRRSPGLSAFRVCNACEDAITRCSGNLIHFARGRELLAATHNDLPVK
jgi:hypothetical protein